MRRLACLVAVLGVSTLGTTACATTSPLSGVTRHSHVSLWQAGWCAFHGYRMVHDFRTHHLGWGALQTALTTYHCSKLLASVRP